MSLVGLKKLFSREALAPILHRSSKPGHNALVLGWSNVSQEPLLGPKGRCVSPAACGEGTPSETSDTDLESQAASADKIKGFRISSRVVSDATIGLSDGLTVPFALTAGLSALGNTKVVVYGGLAELIAGAISMGLGGYLGAKSESASYHAQREKTQLLVESSPEAVVRSVADAFEPYELPRKIVEDLTKCLADSPHLADFVMQFQHCEDPPAASRALVSGMTIATAYFLGGLLPLMPYFIVSSNQVYEALYLSITIMVTALFVFGYGKTCVVIGWVGEKTIRTACFSGIQMVVVGGLAAGAAMGLVKLFDSGDGHPASLQAWPS